MTADILAPESGVREAKDRFVKGAGQVIVELKVNVPVLAISVPSPSAGLRIGFE